MTELPEGLTTRPLDPNSDARAVFELMAVQELHDIGSVQIEEADIVSDWARPSHDVAARSIGVFERTPEDPIEDTGEDPGEDPGEDTGEGTRLIAYAELMGTDRADAAVHPDWRGRGIGTWLAHWLQELGRSLGSKVIGMPTPQGSAGDRLMEDLGYHVRWTSWILQLPEGVSIASRELPPGHRVGPARPNQLPQLHDVLEDAFLEWTDRPRETWEDFRAAYFQRPGFEPWMMRVATDPDGVIVGAAIVLMSDQTAYVDRLATRADQRGRGIAQALLVDAFSAARDHGAVVSELNTDSRTGALGLYEKVGMVVTDTWVNRAVTL